MLGIQVALLAEGVDRNLVKLNTICTIQSVALLAEGVDRNFKDRYFPTGAGGRPPRGGRG